MQWLDTEQFDDDKKYVESTARDARERCFRVIEAEKQEENANNNKRKFAFARR
jgi:nitrogen fixation-related uncharacterized protein